MHLKHLSLQGFKSFATKTEFLFPTGVTAIVGPNGSGKSNIADAIRWVLGEQSLRSLRGKSTADMIFAGGQRRPRAGMAEVSLTLDNADGWLPIEFSEVTFTRRAYRSGENEYLINGARVRLLDIAQLLAESGLSQRAYTVIGQGLVDAALSLRPQERRMLFEEAAGIGLYRARRQDAVQRLDETHHNLERAYDIVSEIAPRLRRLEAEAARVEEHRRLSAHLERLQFTWYGYQWGRQQQALVRDKEKASVLESSLETQQEEVSALGERSVQLRQHEGELRARLRDWHRESADLHDKANEVQRELAVAEERTRLLKGQREELVAELLPLDGQHQAQAEQVAQIRALRTQVERELAERKGRLASLEREWATVKEQAQEPVRQRAQVEQELRACRVRLERLNQALLKARAEAAHLGSEQAVAEERRQQNQARHAEVLAELEPVGVQRAAQAERVAQARAQGEGVERDRAERKGQLAELEREWAAAQARALEPERQRVRVEQELYAQRALVDRSNQALLEARALAARLAGEYDALSRMRTTSAATNAGVRALVQANLDGVLGPLVALIQVPAQWQRAIEAALGDDLQAVVVERASIVEQVRPIVEAAGGRVTLLPLDSLRPPPPLPAGALRAADVVTCAGDADKLRPCGERVRPAAETVLGAVALCEDLAAAQALLPGMPPGGRCVTPAGLVLRADGALSVGQVEVGDLADDGTLADAGIRQDARARRELAARAEQAQRRAQEIEERQRAEAGQVAALEARLQELAREAAAAGAEAARVERERLGPARTEAAVVEEALRSHRAALQREETLLERLEAQVAALHQQAGELESEQAVLAARLQGAQAGGQPVEVQLGEVSALAGPAGKGQVPQTFQARLEEIQRRSQEIEGQQRTEADQVVTLEGLLQDLARQAASAGEEAARFEREVVGPVRTEVAVAEEGVRNQVAALQREEGLLNRLWAQISARRQRAGELEVEQAAVATRVQELRAEAARLEEQLEQVRARIQPAEEDLARLRDEQAALEERERRARDRLRDVETRRDHGQLDVARRQDELKMLARRIEEDLGMVELELAESVTAQAPLPLRPLVSPLPVVEELPEGLEDEMQRLKARIRRLGPVNLNAPAEYSEVEERHRFLTEQSADLEAASAQLRQVVAELDELMETAFRETFEAVATRFSETFTALFNGGTAYLELTDPGDLMNTGVDIVARPPGKRAQRLALLSGGERALTAVALLFALLQVSPTPFCVLDEVDAMLDEANVGRFRTLLQELAQQTQFIVITHNRVTTEAAHTIYGVSMGADGVSQVVSLELD